MKLFVWHGDGVLEDYTSGQITAIAPDLVQALQVINEECNFVGDVGAPTDIIELGDCPGVEPRAWVTWGGG